MWVYGAKPAGAWNDLNLARDAFTSFVLNGELTIADKGYMDRIYFIYPTYYPRSKRHQKSIMARHESVNERFKQLSVLRNIYRHSIDDHLTIFLSVANLVQIGLKFESPLFRLDS